MSEPTLTTDQLIDLAIITRAVLGMGRRRICSEIKQPEWLVRKRLEDPTVIDAIVEQRHERAEQLSNQIESAQEDAIVYLHHLMRTTDNARDGINAAKIILSMKVKEVENKPGATMRLMQAAPAPIASARDNREERENREEPAPTPTPAMSPSAGEPGEPGGSGVRFQFCSDNKPAPAQPNTPSAGETGEPGESGSRFQSFHSSTPTPAISPKAGEPGGMGEHHARQTPIAREKRENREEMTSTPTPAISPKAGEPGGMGEHHARQTPIAREKRENREEMTSTPTPAISPKAGEPGGMGEHHARQTPIAREKRENREEKTSTPTLAISQSGRGGRTGSERLRPGKMEFYPTLNRENREEVAPALAMPLNAGEPRGMPTRNIHPICLSREGREKHKPSKRDRREAKKQSRMSRRVINSIPTQNGVTSLR